MKLLANYYSRKLIRYGFLESTKIIARRTHAALVAYYWRYKVRSSAARHTWQTIARRHKAAHNFAQYWVHAPKEFSKLPVWLDMSTLTGQELQKLAYEYSQRAVPADWHNDGSLSQLFYKDIAITVGKDETLSKDIKVSWELSRFQYLFILGKADRACALDRYGVLFKEHVLDWIEKNPYLHGVNWLCPMEVSIRAINWVWAIHFFDASSALDTDTWQRIVCSLYDHLIYLENNWEVFDGRTSNHYLSDLVGYLYICWLFKPLRGFQRKIDTIVAELCYELDKQLLDDGTHYEGSTAYHRLVTELRAHAIFICNELGMPLPNKYTVRYRDMLDFLNWCTPENGQLILIGDNDSGSIIRTIASSTYVKIPPKLDSIWEQPYTTFPDFGLSVIKTATWHVSLRHHAYKNYQPSGHFHNDMHSITVALRGIPVIIDPGTYVYTASEIWRNRFRSITAHNACYVGEQELVPFDDRLFDLEIPQSSDIPRFSKRLSTISVTACHDLYARYGLKSVRMLEFYHSNNSLTITDFWKEEDTLKLSHYRTDLTSCWNFTLGPDIIPEQQSETTWLLRYKNNPLALLTAPDNNFVVCMGWFAPRYGTLEPCMRLYGRQPLETQKMYIIKLVYLA